MQRLPHEPQLLGSVRGTHVLPQRMKPAVHWQMELLQVPLPHELPQAPQFAGSDSVFTHWPVAPQVMKPGGHAVWQVPFTQLRPAPHWIPQPPQLFASTLVLTQVPLQFV